MAVRVFDLNEPSRARLTVVEAAPRRRHEVRRTRHQWLVVGVIALAVPFVLAVLSLGVVR